MTEPEPIAPEVTKLIQLFSEEPALKFPDLDAGALREIAGRVDQRHEELRRAEAALLFARGQLEEEQEALLKMAQRAHAYLRVYAENDAALASRVEAILLPRGHRAAGRAGAPERLAEGEPMPKKRGRPRKVVDSAASLFSGEQDVIASGSSGSSGSPVELEAAVGQH